MPDLALIAGVIGGLGPAATIDFMARVMALTPAKTDQEHLRLIVDQNPRVPNRQDAALAAGPNPGPALAATAAGLEQAGADFIVMPCNAAHAFAADIAGAISIPFVSIIEATLEALPAGASSIGVLETPACLETGLYHRALSEAGLSSVALAPRSCDELMRIAYAVKQGGHGDAERLAARALADELVSSGADAIIIGCTEIPLVLAADDAGVPLVSSTDALARKTIAIALGKYPLPNQDDPETC